MAAASVDTRLHRGSEDVQIRPGVPEADVELPQFSTGPAALVYIGPNCWWGVSFRCFLPVLSSGVSVGDTASVESRRRVVCVPAVEVVAKGAKQVP